MSEIIASSPGKLLKRLREFYGMTIRELADALEQEDEYMVFVEQGRRKIARWQIEQFVDKLGATLEVYPHPETRKNQYRVSNL